MTPGHLPIFKRSRVLTRTLGTLLSPRSITSLGRCHAISLRRSSLMPQELIFGSHVRHLMPFYWYRYVELYRHERLKTFGPKCRSTQKILHPITSSTLLEVRSAGEHLSFLAYWNPAQELPANMKTVALPIGAHSRKLCFTPSTLDPLV